MSAPQDGAALAARNLARLKNQASSLVSLLAIYETVLREDPANWLIGNDLAQARTDLAAILNRLRLTLTQTQKKVAPGWSHPGDKV